MSEQEFNPGIHPSIPFPIYQKIPGMNGSTLIWGRKSMLHLKAAIDGKIEKKDTEAFKFGRALHTRLLEPDAYKERHPIMPDFGKMQSSINRDKRDAWLANLPAGVEAIRGDDANAIEECAKAVANHPAEHLRKCKGQFEVVVIGELLGVRCKARLDKLIVSPRLTIMDVKKVAAPTNPSAPSGDPESFEKRIDNYGYGMFAAFQSDLVSQHFDGQVPDYYWLVVEDDHPFGVGVYKAEPELIAAGRNEYLTLLSRMKSCQSSDKWPGFSADIVKLQGPQWWRKQNGG